MTGSENSKGGRSTGNENRNLTGGTSTGGDMTYQMVMEGGTTTLSPEMIQAAIHQLTEQLNQARQRGQAELQEGTPREEAVNCRADQRASEKSRAELEVGDESSTDISADLDWPSRLRKRPRTAAPQGQRKVGSVFTKLGSEQAKEASRLAKRLDYHDEPAERSESTRQRTRKEDEARCLRRRLAELEAQEDEGEDDNQNSVDDWAGPTPFSKRISDADLPTKFKIPPIGTYNGETDPAYHLDNYVSWMRLQKADEMFMCQAFPLTLGDLAKSWFSNLPNYSISGWKELSELFLTQFMGSKKRRTPKEKLLNFKQNKGESLKAYLERFNKLILGMEYVHDETKLMTAMAGLRVNSKVWWSVREFKPKTYHEFLRQTEMYVDAEEAIQEEQGAREHPERREKEKEGSRRQPSFRPPGNFRPYQATEPSRDRPKQPDSAERVRTILTVSPRQILAAIQDQNLLPEPRPQRPSPSWTNSKKYCEYHRASGHGTDACRHLLAELMKLIERGHLDQFVKRPGPPKEQVAPPAQRLPPPPIGNPPIREINTLINHNFEDDRRSKRARRRYIREARNAYQRCDPPKRTAEGHAITFYSMEAEGLVHPHEDPLIAVLDIQDIRVHRVLVDTGSYANVLYLNTYRRMGLREADLEPTSEVAVGFGGQTTKVLGKCLLKVAFEMEGEKVYTLTEFRVVDAHSTYNAIWGRPLLAKLKAVVSIYHQAIKFPVGEKIFVIEGNQLAARECEAGLRPREINQVGEASQSQSDELAQNDQEQPFQELETLDPRGEHEVRASPVEELDLISPDPSRPDVTFNIGRTLEEPIRAELIQFLGSNTDVFAWTHEDMEGIRPEDACHHLHLSPSAKPVVQKRRRLSPDRYEGLEMEVQKLLANGFIKETQYAKWVANPVLVKKSSGSWRMCIDFTDLNKACPKDCFPLPNIDQLVDTTAGHELMSFMDAYSGYHQIPMAEQDRVHTTFVTDRAQYCYKAMPFGLKNAGATYQRLVNKMFAAQIGKTMEVYVDDMLVKSKRKEDHVADLAEMFGILRRYRMKLNPKKCTFGVGSGKFLGYMVSQRGIEANPEKIKAIIDLTPPRRVKDIQCLTGKVAALNRFISKSTDKCRPFFDLIRKDKKFEWTSECGTALEELKKSLMTAPVLAKPLQGEKLQLYLAVSSYAISAVLTRTERSSQQPIYYVSHSLHDAELRYPPMEKLAYALVTSARKLRPYFLAHRIEVLTNFPLRQVLGRPDASGRLLKWAVELGQYDVQYSPRTAIKGQALADFIVEFTPTTPIQEESQEKPWKMYVDGSSTVTAAGAGIVLISPSGKHFCSALRFKFKATNNEAEYEALLAGLEMAKQFGVDDLEIFSDSLLMVNQISGEYEARDERMAAYLQAVEVTLAGFRSTRAEQVPRIQNAQADALAKLSTSEGAQDIGSVNVGLMESSALESQTICTIDLEDTWMSPIIKYLQEDTRPDDPVEARRLRIRAARYTLKDGILYKRGFSLPLLRCLSEREAEYALREVHEGICGNHTGGQALAFKIIRMGYFWPSLKKEAIEFARKCDKCQRYAPFTRAPPEELNMVLTPWPFAKWGIDLIGPMPTGRGGVKHAIVAVDYFTKWAEAEPLAKITSGKITDFVWKSIICRFGLPQSLVTDNGRQFDSEEFAQFCSNLGIQKLLSTPYHPKGNGQVEAINKIIKHTLKARLDELKGAWADELPGVLWSYRTTARSATGETPFSLAFGAEAVIPVEVGIPTWRATQRDEEGNEVAMLACLDLVEEKRLESELRNAVYKQRSARYYNSKVRARKFEVGDLVLRKVVLNTRETNAGCLGPNWEGPYKIARILSRGAYELESLAGRVLDKPWNAELLKRYFR